ncbi:MBL fold metallo-hydrolase [Chloroflexota bacterium]
MEVIPHVYQIAIKRANVTLIAEEELTLVDTGFRGSSSKITSFIRCLRRSVEEISLIILTYNHLDHVGGLPGLKLLTPAKVAAHKADISATESQLPYSKTVRCLLRIPPIFIIRPLVYITPSDVDIWLEGDEELSPLGGLRVIQTPGHTHGSISLFSAEKKLLIVGDALNNRYNHLRLPPKMVSTDLVQAVLQ